MKRKDLGLTHSGLIIIIVLCAVVIIGLLLYFNNQKKRNFITEAKNFISEVRTLVTEDKIVVPSTYDEKVIISISQINTDKGLVKSSFGKNWVIEKSYIIIKNSGTEYTPVYSYYIALEDEGGNCVELSEEKKLNRNSVIKECNIDEYAETAATYIE